MKHNILMIIGNPTWQPLVNQVLSRLCNCLIDLKWNDSNRFETIIFYFQINMSLFDTISIRPLTTRAQTTGPLTTGPWQLVPYIYGLTTRPDQVMWSYVLSVQTEGKAPHTPL